MTARRESLPSLNGAEARWDAEAGKVRYYANFDGSDDWIEISGEDFARLSQHCAQLAIDVVCHAITDTLDNVKGALTELMTFREKMVEMFERQIVQSAQNVTKRDEEKGN